MSKEEISPQTLQVPQAAPPTKTVDDDPCTMSLYLEVPTQSRRRRSYQFSICSECNSETGSPTPLVNVEELSTDDLFDSPRLFTEMLTLTEEKLDSKIWKEAARWVRFEEDVEEASRRWSKPRVSTLSLHSFFELRSFLVNGLIAMDVEGFTLEEIFNNALPMIYGKKRLSVEQIQQVQDILKCKIVHLFEARKHHNEVLKHSPKKMSHHKTKKEKYEGDIEEQGPLHDSNDDENEIFKGNKQFLKKLTEGTEAANILIGEVYFLQKPICVFLRLKDATSLGSLTEVPVPSRFMFLLLGPMGQLSRYMEIGRSIATLLSDEVFREVAYKGRNKTHILAGMDEFLDASTLLPPGEWDPNIRIEPPSDIPTKESRKKTQEKPDDGEKEKEERRLREESGLVRTGRLFGGLINDLKRKIPWYKSDYTDAISLQSVASFFFIYFACLAPIVTFGGLLGDATGNNIAVMESLVAALINGVIYGLFSGQPLTVLGSTGPVLVFESIVYEFCRNHEWNYLSLRLWIGLWATLILMILVAIDASSLVCYITRFTEENFATLIGLIYIMKAIEKVAIIGKKYPMETNVDVEKLCNCSIDYQDHNNTGPFLSLEYEECHYLNGTIVDDNCHKYYPDVFLLSILLFFATFLISVSLKNFKTASFFTTKVREIISDFSVTITIVLMTTIDYLLGIATPKLWVPTELKPTSPTRGWVVPPFDGNPWWTSLLAFLPALLACILIFMDQQITSVIVNRKEHRLKKGGGFHLDLFVLAILIGINSVMGLPWFVAATVLSINHVNSLKIESKCAAPGEKPQFLGVRENRVTHVLIFLLIGLSVFLTPILSRIPMSVLYGVFMYMGITALGDIQFFERILLIFMPAKFQPDRAFLRKVPLKRVHIYTGIQLACLVVLWAIKSFRQTSILFPLMLVIMVGIRKGIECIFTQRELRILDDALPEFSRKKKIEEEGDEDNEDEEKDKDNKGENSEFKRERLMSISLANGGIIKTTSFSSVNFSDEINKSGLWSLIDNNIKPTGSMDSSRKSSVSSILRMRRKSTILDPIFCAHSYPNIHEEETNHIIPNEYKLISNSRKDSKDSNGPTPIIKVDEPV